MPQFSCDDGSLFQTGDSGLQNAPLMKRFANTISLSWGEGGWLSGGSCLVGHRHTVFQSRVKGGHHAGLILTLFCAQCVYCVAEVKEVGKKKKERKWCQ